MLSCLKRIYMGEPSHGKFKGTGLHVYAIQVFATKQNVATRAHLCMIANNAMQRSA
jgi:hypothetical protein